MRDIIVVGLVVLALPFALWHTWIAVLLWTWVSLMNPHRLTFGFAYSTPIAAMAAGAALISLLITKDKLRMTWSPPVVVLLLFVMWMCVTTALAFDPATSWDQLNKVLKIQLMTGIGLIALQEKKHIDLFILVNIISIGYFGFKGGIFTILTGGGYRVWGPEDSFISDNNALAAALIICIPLMNYWRSISQNRWIRIGFLVLMILCTISAVGSQSRGALIAITMMGITYWYRSNKKFSGGVAIILIAISLLAFMPSSWEQRMSTITNYEGEGSAMSRLIAWQFCFNLANDRFFGGGFEIYNWPTYWLYAPEGAYKPFAAHSIYFSVLGEHGYVGLILFVLIWILSFRVGAQIRKETKNRPEFAWLHHLAGMCQVSLIGYLAGGTFLSLAYFDLPYNILIVLVAYQRWLSFEIKKESRAPAKYEFGINDLKTSWVK
ncbi:MAG: putative O-glycosylation ligase, exosortase A system-associated [Candidatus Accumulibacter sp.]|nr:putative O-glycosylation ligase, exosortase A system-associated [Accumulibacter sp.]